MTRQVFLALAASTAISVMAAPPTVVVKKAGAERTVVSVETSGGNAAAQAFNTSLKRNLSLTGYFQVGPNGQIRVTGTPGAGVVATGAGKQVTSQATFADAKAARMAARQFSDAIVQAYIGKKGFACDRIAFINRMGADNAELYTCYPDGYDIRQLTSDRRAAVGPRWAPNKEEIYYTGFLQRTPLVYHIDMAGRRNLLAQFKGLATGAAVSPNGADCAIILSHQGNPELYVINFATKRVKRMTKTQNASEDHERRRREHEPGLEPGRSPRVGDEARRLELRGGDGSAQGRIDRASRDRGRQLGASELGGRRAAPDRVSRQGAVHHRHRSRGRQADAAFPQPGQLDEPGVGEVMVSA